MSSTISESKNVAKRVMIGVVTGLATTATIYFLGFNRSTPKATQIEIKKNTIQAWKSFIDIENKIQPKYDTNLAKVRRAEITIQQYKTADSLTSIGFIQDMEPLKEEKDIDQDLNLLFTTRIDYKKQEMQNSFAYFDRFAAIADSAIPVAEKNLLIAEMNKEFEAKRNNFIERVGRNIEGVAATLARKYKYPFRISDFSFNLFYQTLKKSRTQPQLPTDEPAPSDPNIPLKEPR